VRPVRGACRSAHRGRAEEVLLCFLSRSCFQLTSDPPIEKAFRNSKLFPQKPSRRGNRQLEGILLIGRDTKNSRSRGPGVLTKVKQRRGCGFYPGAKRLIAVIRSS